MGAIDVLKEDLKKQLAHAASLVEGGAPDRLDHYRGLVSGSEIMMDIVESFFRLNSGTKGYMKLLDEDQLRYAQLVVDELLCKKEAECMIRLWSTAGGEYWLTSEPMAIQELKDQISEIDINSSFDRDDYMIHSTLVRESELNKYISPEAAADQGS